MADPVQPSLNTGGLLGLLLGGALGGTQGGMTPAGTTTTTTNQTLVPGALQNLQDTIAGRYLDPASNPWLSSTYDAAARQVTPRVNSLFEAGGRYGSGANQGVLGQNLSDLASNIYGTNYQNERTRQLAAAAGPIGNTVTSPYFTNPLAGILSGGLAGGALGNLFGGSGGFGGILNGLPSWLGGTGGSTPGAGGGAGTDPNVDPNTGFPGNYPGTDPNVDPNTGFPASELRVGPSAANYGATPGLYGSGFGARPKPVSSSPYVRSFG